MPSRLLGRAGAGIDEQQHEIGGRTARDHVARVLGVAGGVRDDEPALRGGEVAVGDVDGDALFPLGPEPVGEKRKVHVLIAPRQARALHGLELVLEYLFRVVEETADECGLAVVDRTPSRKTKQLH